MIDLKTHLANWANGVVGAAGSALAVGAQLAQDVDIVLKLIATGIGIAVGVFTLLNAIHTWRNRNK